MVSSVYVFWRRAWPQAQESHLPPPPSATTPTPSSVVILFLVVVVLAAPSETKHVKCILRLDKLTTD